MGQSSISGWVSIVMIDYQTTRCGMNMLKWQSITCPKGWEQYLSIQDLEMSPLYKPISQTNSGGSHGKKSFANPKSKQFSVIIWDVNRQSTIEIQLVKPQNWGWFIDVYTIIPSTSYQIWGSVFVPSKFSLTRLSWTWCCSSSVLGAENDVASVFGSSFPCFHEYHPGGESELQMLSVAWKPSRSWSQRSKGDWSYPP